MVAEEVRRVSSAVFGHRYRLELLAALVTAGDEGVCVTTLATERRVATSVFYPPLRLLMEIGLARRLSPAGQDRRVFYVPTDHAAWTGLQRVVQDLGVEVSDRDETDGESR